MKAFVIRWFLVSLLLGIFFGVSGCSSGGGNTPPGNTDNDNNLGPVDNAPGGSSNPDDSSSDAPATTGGFEVPIIANQAVTITPGNEDIVLRTAINSTTGVFNAGSELTYSPILSGQIAGQTNSTNVYGVLQQSVITSISKEFQNPGSVSITGVTFQDSVNCALSGSVIYSGDAVDPNGVSISVGDTITQRFTNCDDGNGVIYDGVIMAVANSDISSPISDTIFNFDVSVSFDNFKITAVDSSTIVLHGNLDTSLVTNINGYVLTLSGDSLYIITPDESAQLIDFNLSIAVDETSYDTSIDANYVVASSIIEGHISVATHLEVNSFVVYPNAGYAHITGNNSQLSITVNDSSTVSMTLTTGGVTETGYPKVINWSDLAVNVCELANCLSSGNSFIPPELPDQVVQISADNEVAVAQTAYAAIQTAVSSDYLVSAAAIGAPNNRDSQSLNGLLDKLSRMALDTVVNQTSVPGYIGVTGVISTDSVQCVRGGSYTTYTDLADPTGTSVVAGDKIIIIYENCDDGLNEVINGTLAVLINTFDSANTSSFDFFVDYWNFSFTNTLGGTTVIHGSARMGASLSTSADISTFVGSSIYIITPETDFHLSNFDFEVVADQILQTSVINATFSVASTAIDGLITVESHLENDNASIVFYPNAGSINIMGEGSQLDLDVIDNATLSITLQVGGVIESGYPKTVGCVDLGL